MPRTMFTEVVSPDTNFSRNWYTVPLSLIVHASVFAVIVAIPLVATDDLPKPPQSMLHFIPVAPPPPPPAAPRIPPQATKVAASTQASPVEAPRMIGSESGVVPDHAAIQARGIDGLTEWSGRNGIVIEQPPLVSVPPAPVRAGGDIKAPVRIKNTLPVYPHIARAAKVQGVVIIEAIIGVDGTVENARVIRSIPLLDPAALDAVRAWEYTPTLLNGRPTPVIMTVTVQFTLNWMDRL